MGVTRTRWPRISADSSGTDCGSEEPSLGANAAKQRGRQVLRETMTLRGGSCQMQSS
jgi:hypothetical protein